MRAGEDLVPMTDDMLCAIFDENRPDFSAEICRGATMSDLDPVAIEEFRRRWHLTSENASLLTRPAENLLRDAELIMERGVTYAALILLGSKAALSEHLAAAEIVFEYRATAAPGPANQRVEFRCAFLLAYDRVWELVNLRNDKQHYLYRLVMYPVPTFSELSVREALLNAVAHRDYRHPGSIFVRQYSRRIEVVSPGGFPSGITLQNILYRQNPRNRRLADSFARCGLVERAGQGTDRIYEECVTQGKPLPDFTHTDKYQVALTLHGEVADDGFLQFLHRLREEAGVDAISTHDLLVFDCVRRGNRVPKDLRPWLRKLVKQRVLESTGSGRATTYSFASRLLGSSGRAPAQAIRAGRETGKEVLLRHIIANSDSGTRFDELRLVVLPELSRDQIQTLLRELKGDGAIIPEGVGRGAKWYASTSKTQLNAILGEEDLENQ